MSYGIEGAIDIDLLEVFTLTIDIELMIFESLAWTLNGAIDNGSVHLRISLTNSVSEGSVGEGYFFLDPFPELISWTQFFP